jgi:hypothetical protein
VILGSGTKLMRRREFFTLLGGVAAAWPLVARAQQPTRRIGMLIGYAENDPEIQARLAAFRQALEGSGWKEGGNLRIDYRFAPASPDQAQVYAKFGTRGSQVQILPLRPALSRFFVLFGPRIGHRNKPGLFGRPLVSYSCGPPSSHYDNTRNNVSTACPLVSATA